MSVRSKKKIIPIALFVFHLIQAFDALGGIRTHDLQVTSPLLCQLRYWALGAAREWISICMARVISSLIFEKDDQTLVLYICPLPLKPLTSLHLMWWHVRPRLLKEYLQSVSWSLAEFRHNKIVQSPHENYFNVCRQHKEKWDLVKMTIIQTWW